MQAQLNSGMKIKTVLKHHHHEFLNLLGTGSHENILNVLDFVHILCTLYTLNCVLYGVWYVGCSVQCFVLWGLVWFQHLCRESVCAVWRMINGCGAGGGGCEEEEQQSALSPGGERGEDKEWRR